MLNKFDSAPLLARGAVPFETPNWLQTLNRLLSPAAWRRPDPQQRAPLDVEPEDHVGDIKVKWSPAALRRLLEEELPGADVIVVSNREPYIHNRTGDGDIALQMPASGLVSALEPITRACGGTWIAHGSGSADADVVDGQDRIAVPPDDPSYALRRVWLSDAEQDGYYYGLANEGLWPLCHLAYVRPEFRQEDWAQYVAVNRKFADAVVDEAKSEAPVVLVQDYHFALLPRMIRERLPNATIITFWHIPWPNPEVFGICPWRDEILDGLLGSTVMAFHTPAHCHNFIDCVDRYLESRIDREQSTITRGGVTTCIRPYPISIEWPPRALRDQPTIAECRRIVREQLKLPGDIVMAVGVERFDFTKGILERFRAVEDLLERYPNWRERFVFVQVAAPTRTKLAAYQQLEAETRALVTAVNQRFGTPTWQPIVLLARHHEPDEVFTLFRAADACVVSSLHDGMNLVAKEFIAARDDEEGVLILSSFAGAAAELIDAVVINPYDTAGTADGLDFALRMPRKEQRHRMSLMRSLVAEHNVYRWAGRMLLDAAKLRRHSRIR
jgi:trehalose-6-phosphate synthase